MTNPSTDPFDILEEGTDIPDDLIKALLQNARNSRLHAGYFSLKGNKNKPLNEISTFDNWLEAYGKFTTGTFKLEYRQNPLDPPDIVLIDDKGRHGIELTELVDGPSIAAREKNVPIYDKEYSAEELHGLIKTRILEKTAKPFKDTSCISKILIIYSDELFIENGISLGVLSSMPPVKQSFFNEIWMMIRPEPNTLGGEPKNPNHRIYQIKCA